MDRKAVSFTALAVSALAAIALYASIAAGIARQWFDDANSSHGILLAAAAAFVLRRTWRTLPSLEVRPRNSGFVLLILAVLVYALGTVSGDLFVLRASMPVAVLGFILALWGPAHARALFPALALATLAIPLPGVLVTYLTMPLQLIGSQVAAGVLAASNVPVVRDGNLLALPNITLDVAEACNGLRSVVSLVSVAAIGAATLQLTPRRSALLIIAAVPIAVVGNGLRVAATGLLALRFGEVAVKGAIHEMTGFVAFVLMCAATVAVLRFTRTEYVSWARQLQ